MREKCPYRLKNPNPEVKIEHCTKEKERRPFSLGGGGYACIEFYQHGFQYYTQCFIYKKEKREKIKEILNV